MIKKAIVFACVITALPVGVAGPAMAWDPGWNVGCEGNLNPNGGPSWDLGPECKAVEEPVMGVVGATVDYAYAQAYAVCTFVNGVDPNLSVDCDRFAGDEG